MGVVEEGDLGNVFYKRLGRSLDRDIINGLDVIIVSNGCEKICICCPCSLSMIHRVVYAFSTRRVLITSTSSLISRIPEDQIVTKGEGIESSDGRSTSVIRFVEYLKIRWLQIVKELRHQMIISTSNLMAMRIFWDKSPELFHKIA